MNLAPRRIRTVITVACGAFLLTAPLAFSKSRWIKITSPNFEMFTSASQGAGRRTIQDFEQIRRFFIDVTQTQKAPALPIRIIAFGSRKDYEPYKTREFAAAYYLAGHDRDYIVMSRIGADTRPTAIHEYVHLLVRHTGLKFPPWLNEGFAVLYSMGYLVDSSSHYILGVGVPALVASTIVL